MAVSLFASPSVRGQDPRRSGRPWYPSSPSASSDHLVTDQPARVGGDGSAPAPHELFPAALAACVAATLVVYARTKQWELGDVTVDVDYDHRSTPRRFTIDIQLTGELSAAQLERLEKVAAACPLRRSIESGIEFVERIELRRDHRDRGARETSFVPSASSSS